MIIKACFSGMPGTVYIDNIKYVQALGENREEIIERYGTKGGPENIIEFGDVNYGSTYLYFSIWREEPDAWWQTYGFRYEGSSIYLMNDQGQTIDRFS